MEQFKIEIAMEGLGYVYDIRALGNSHYEIYDQENRVGIIEIDGEDHQRCKAVDCEIDMPLMNAIRDGIVLHQELQQRRG